MYIYPVTYSPINFKANERFVADKNGHLAYKTTTYWFRTDTDWDRLNNFLCDKYKNVNKVNVISHACSNGMEPYSFAMHMKSFHPSYADKFLPIMAKDIDKNNILMAKRGFYETEKKDLFELEYLSKVRYKDFLNCEYSGGILYPNSVILRPNEKLRKCVNFEQGNIFDDIEKMPRKNTVLFCKNFWPYLKVEQREELAKKLAEHFDKTCVIITGDYDDIRSNVCELFKKNGFHQYPIRNVWQKTVNF